MSNEIPLQNGGKGVSFASGGVTQSMPGSPQSSPGLSKSVMSSPSSPKAPSAAAARTMSPKALRAQMLGKRGAGGKSPGGGSPATSVKSLLLDPTIMRTNSKQAYLREARRHDYSQRMSSEMVRMRVASVRNKTSFVMRKATGTMGKIADETNRLGSVHAKTARKRKTTLDEIVQRSSGVPFRDDTAMLKKYVIVIYMKLASSHDILVIIWQCY